MWYVVDATRNYQTMFKALSRKQAEVWIEQRSKFEPEKVYLGSYQVYGPVITRD